MTKEGIDQGKIKAELEFLRTQADALLKTCESIALTIKAGDVTFAAVEDISNQLDRFSAREVNRSVRGVFKTLKGRALERIKAL